MKEKISELHLHKQKSFRVLIVIELILLLGGVPGLFGKNRVYEYGVENMHAAPGILERENGICYADESAGEMESMVDFVDISLPRGVYDVEVHYQTDTSMLNYCSVSRGTAGYKGLLSIGEHCYPAREATDFRMWLLEDAAGIGVHVSYGGQGTLSVSGLTVKETNALNRIWIFCMAAVSAIANLCYLYIAYDRRFGISVKNKTIHFILALTVLFSSMPLMVDYVANSGDLLFHLLRVEGIKDSILNGQFPNRIAPEWQQGYGYASPIFYGETALYIMAFFRLIGFTILTSYRMFFFLLNIATVLVSYYCFKKIFGEEYIGLLCTVLYVLSVYRIYKTFYRGGFGESVAITLLPVLAYGFYRVLSEAPESEGYQRSFVPLTIGFTGLIQSHLLTGELAGLFTIILCLIMIKKVFRRQTFIVLGKTVVYSCLLSAWFLVPFLDYMLTGNFVIQNVSARTIQERGLYPAHLSFAFPISGSTTLFHLSGMYDSQSENPGIILFVMLLLWAGLRFFGRTSVLKKEELALGRIAAWFAVLSMGMSLYLFPWDRIQAWNGLTATLVSSLQFPGRMLGIAVIMLTILAGVSAKCIAAHYGKQGELILTGAMVVMIMMSNLWLLTYMNYHMGGARLYNEEGMGSGYISGAEYLPYGADPSLFIPGEPRMYGDIRLDGYKKDGLTADVKCANIGAETGAMELPLLFYKGYRAWDMDTGERFAVQAGENFSVKVLLPAGYNGTVRTAFVSPFYWRIAEGVSVAAFGLLSGYGCLHGRQRRKREEAAE